MGKAGQFLLLMWKNLVLIKRAPVRTFLEIIMPLFFVTILVLLRAFQIKNEYRSNVTYPAFEINKLPDNLKQLHLLAFAPNTSDVQQVMDMVKEQFSPFNITTVPFQSEEDMVQTLVSLEGKRNKPSGAQFLGGVAFNTSLDHGNIVYKIRLRSKSREQEKPSKEAREDEFGMDPSATWNTQFTFPIFEVPGPRNKNASHGGPPFYFEEGFLSLQHAVDTAIIKLKGNISGELNASVSIKRFPYPDHIHDNFVLVIQFSLHLLLMLSLVFTALNIVRDVVYEKQKKLKVSDSFVDLCCRVFIINQCTFDLSVM